MRIRSICGRIFWTCLASWKIIIGLPLIVGILAAVYFVFLQTPSYEATALVAVTEASFSVEVTTDSRVTTTDDLTSSYDAYPELALSDSLIDELYREPSLADVWPSDIQDSEELKEPS